MIGRTAYGYVIWQKANPSRIAETISPKLMPLLKWKGGAKGATEASSVLALLRSGTLGQAVTFIVFRGKPDEQWRKVPPDHREYERREALDLDPGRLAPADSVTGTFDVFVGICRHEMPRIREHPLVIILEAAANKLIVLDAQLPVPAPVAGHDDRQWARIRLALRDNADISRLTGFLSAVNAAMSKSENARHVVAVRAVPAVRPRVDTEPDAGEAQDHDGAGHAHDREGDSSVLTSDLDIVNDAGVGDEPPGARTWRVLTLCADARSNIESDMIGHLASVREHFQLRGLTYALLHGTAVMVLLVHEPAVDPVTGALLGRVVRDGEKRAAALPDDLHMNPAWAKLRVPVNQPLSRAELGGARRYPLLRVRFRWQDRPGALLNMIRSINEVLTEELPSLHGQDWSISYASLQVLTGQVAGGWLTIRMHMPAEKISDWDLSRMEEMGRKIETLATARAAGRRPGSSGTDPGRLEDPVVSIDRIKKIGPGHRTGVPGPWPAEPAGALPDRDRGDVEDGAATPTPGESAPAGRAERGGDNR